MPYPRDPFAPTIIINTPNPASPPVGAVPFSAEEANKLGNGIKDTREGLHLARYRLNDNEYNPFNPVNEFPVTSESIMTVTTASWPETGGIVRTVRHRGSVASDAAVAYDYQEFKAANSDNYYSRYAKKVALDAWAWTNTRVFAVNDLAKPTVDDGYYYRVTAVSGNARTATTEPTWPANGTFTSSNGSGSVTFVREGAFWSDWQVGIRAKDPTFTGKVTNTPSATQVIDATGDNIVADATTVLISNTTGGAITLASTPIIPDGVVGQRAEITNIGTQNVVVRDQGTLAGSNLRLGATSRTIGPLDTLIVKFLNGDWVEVGFVTTV
jgi:hypothetical protein